MQTLNLEIEFKFFINDPSPQLLNELKSCPNNKRYSQHIFSHELSQKLLLPLALKYLPTAKDIPDLSKLKGRVRSIESNKSKVFMLGLKGPKNQLFKDLGIISKPEIEIQITELEFNELVGLADKGYLIKNRTEVPCEASYEGKIYQLFAEFDYILEVNSYPLISKFLIVEIEIPENNSSTLINVVRSGAMKLEFPTRFVDFKNLEATEVEINSQEDFADLISSRKLLTNISVIGPAKHLSKYFYE
ncbi:MAG: hypothetical protein WD512_02475 [Candidatus Paceibacterota bacterium]